MIIPRRALALDFGRVLTLDPDKTTFDAVLRRLNIPAADFTRAWSAHREAYDRGLLDSWAYWKGVLTMCVQDLSDAKIQQLFSELVEADFASWAVPRSDMHRVVQAALDAQVPTAIVSNMPRGLGSQFVTAWPWLNRIPHRFFSAEIGLAKPDSNFYHHVLKQTGWAPQDVLFVDDMPANIETADSLGFKTLLFTGVPKDLEIVRSWYRE